MLLPLLFLAAQAAAAPETIVVTGVPLKTLHAAADQCEKAGCPIRDDVVATVRYAEGLFRVGRYVESRTTLQRAVSRNKARARSDPAAMSALYEATATVSRHEGDQNVVMDTTYARARLLEDTSTNDSPDRLLANLDVLDMLAEYQPSIQLLSRYDALVRRSRAAHQPAVTARVLLHYATLAHAARKDRVANELVADLVANRDGAPPVYQFVGRAMAIRFARDRGNKGAVEAFVAEMATQPAGAVPVLIWAPPIPLPADPTSYDPTEVRISRSIRETDYATLGWADIGFTIKGDGSVEQQDVLRSNRPDSWAKPLVKMIGARRYAPLAETSDARYRVERWTLTADYGTPAGSIIRRRVFNAHYEQLDLTTGEPKPAGKAS